MIGSSITIGNGRAENYRRRHKKAPANRGLCWGLHEQIGLIFLLAGMVIIYFATDLPVAVLLIEDQEIGEPIPEPVFEF